MIHPRSIDLGGVLSSRDLILRGCPRHLDHIDPMWQWLCDTMDYDRTVDIDDCTLAYNANEIVPRLDKVLRCYSFTVFSNKIFTLCKILNLYWNMS